MMNLRRPRAAWAGMLALVALPLGVPALAAQTPAGVPAGPSAAGRTLSLDDAVAIAERQSPTVRIARAGVARAEGQLTQARAQYLPQLSASASYTRTLASPFSALASSAPVDTARPVTGPDSVLRQLCTPYYLGGNASAAQRQQALALAETCRSSAGGFGGINFQKVGFGAPNQYSLGLAGSLSLFTGGRVSGQNQSAAAGRQSATVELTAQRAQLTLDVTQAYFDAALADRLVSIAEGTLAENDTVLKQTTLARQVGSQSEFDLLRARVARDNQIPVVLQRRNDRETARLRLKQLLNLPLSDSVTLTTTLGDDAQQTTLRGVSNLTEQAPDTSTERRAPVREAELSVRAQEGLRRVARAEYIPQLQLSSSYGKVAYPLGNFPSSLGDFVNNWTVTVAASVPLFTGGRIHGDQLVAQANLDEARARLQQVREFAGLDASQALATLQQAEAAYAASAGTSEQAARAYSIGELRYREGLSTQIELTDSRILLDQAAANRAMAARNLQVARVRLALIRDLPLSTGATSSSSAASTNLQQQTSPSTTTPQATSGTQTQAQTTSTSGATGAVSTSQIPGTTGGTP